MKPNPFNGDVHAWCESHDQYAAEDWLYLVLDGTYTVDEMRAAVLADRAPEKASVLDDDDKRLTDEILGLPEYRGWYVSRDDNRDLVEKLVWKHDDYDTKIWFDLVRKDKGRVDLSIDVDDPNDDPYCPHGDYVTLPEHTAAAVFAVCKPLLDEYGDGDEADAGTEAAEVTP
jgi:hypothetical protein